MILLTAVAESLAAREAETSPVTSQAEPVTLRTPAHGDGKLQVGNPGNKGGGKHPDAFRALMREIATKAAEVAAANIVGNDRHPAFLGAAKWSSEHGYGRPVETREYSGTVTVRVVRDTGPIVEPEQIEDGE